MSPGMILIAVGFLLYAIGVILYIRKAREEASEE